LAPISGMSPRLLRLGLGGSMTPTGLVSLLHGVITGPGAALAESAFGDVADDAVAAPLWGSVEHPVRHQPFS
jgi:hypothetical protein